MAYKGRTEFNDNKNLLIFLISISIVVFSIAIWAPVSNDEKWIKYFCWSIAILCVISIIDTVMTFVRLDNDELIYRKNFLLYKISRQDIKKVTHKKGCSVIVKLKNGRNIELPEVGPNGIENSIRAWLSAND